VVVTKASRWKGRRLGFRYSCIFGWSGTWGLEDGRLGFWGKAVNSVVGYLWYICCCIL
jgi:hypothetical protein